MLQQELKNKNKPPHLYHIKGGNMDVQVKHYQVLNMCNTDLKMSATLAYLSG